MAEKWAICFEIDLKKGCASWQEKMQGVVFLFGSSRLSFGPRLALLKL